MGSEARRGSGPPTDAATAVSGSKATSQPQQSLQREHFSQRWLAQLSLVQATQMSVEVSSQILQVNGMAASFQISFWAAGPGPAWKRFPGSAVPPGPSL
jgi:hypothetical protein